MFILYTESSEEALLKQALEMSMEPGDDSETPGPADTRSTTVDFAMMSEEEQIAYAMRMSMQPDGQYVTTN